MRRSRANCKNAKLRFSSCGIRKSIGVVEGTLSFQICAGNYADDAKESGWRCKWGGDGARNIERYPEMSKVPFSCVASLSSAGDRLRTLAFAVP